MPQQHRDLIPVTVYLPPDVLAKLEKQAGKEVSTVSAVARRALVEWAEPLKPA